MAAIDIYVNETTRHADVILPPTTALERDHYDLVFHGLAVRNTARFTPACCPSPRAPGTTGRSTASSRSRIQERLVRRAGLRARSGSGPGWRRARRCCSRACCHRRRDHAKRLRRQPEGSTSARCGRPCPSGCRPRTTASTWLPTSWSATCRGWRPGSPAARERARLPRADRAPAQAGQQRVVPQRRPAQPRPAPPPAAHAPRRPGRARHRRRRAGRHHLAGRQRRRSTCRRART